MDYYFQKIKNIWHLFGAILANIYYGFPSRNITVIGVSGTDGKTTTTSLIYHILKSAGEKVSMISTVTAMVGEKNYDTGFHVTTPSEFMVQKFIKQAVDAGDKYFVLETTSHALDQYRVFGVKFSYGLITNVSREHLLYHKTYRNYIKAKLKLLEWSKVRIVNCDDESFRYISKKFFLNKFSQTSKNKVAKNVYTYGIKNKADYNLDINSLIGKFVYPFNKYNYIAAYAICDRIGIDEEKIISAMKSFQLPPGRMEVVYDSRFKVIVDFAHTPNAVKEALSSVKKEFNPGRLIHVFGAAAFRDDSKRPIMGQESAKYSNLVILTEEDYRTEDPEKISQQIAKGLETEDFTFSKLDNFGSKNHSYTIIIDRNEAIKKAINMAKPGDLIIITGKGHETSLNRDGKEIPWSDKKAILADIQTQTI